MHSILDKGVKIGFVLFKTEYRIPKTEFRKKTAEDIYSTSDIRNRTSVFTPFGVGKLAHSTALRAGFGLALIGLNWL